MSDDFLSQEEVNVLLKGVTGPSEDDWADAMQEVAMAECKVTMGGKLTINELLLVSNNECIKAQTDLEVARMRHDLWQHFDSLLRRMEK